MPVLRSGKHTTEEKGKAPAKPTASEAEPRAPPNRLDEEMKNPPKKVEYDVISRLRRIPARLSLYEALQLSKEAREALINALVNETVRDFYLFSSSFFFPYGAPFLYGIACPTFYRTGLL